MITSAVDTIATSNPLKKEVAIEAELDEQLANTLMMAAPVLGIIAGLPCAFL